MPNGVGEVQTRALAKGINFRYIDDHTIGISLNETSTIADVDEIV